MAEHEKHKQKDLDEIKRDILADSAFLDTLADEIEKRLAKRIRARGSYLPTYSPVQETK